MNAIFIIGIVLVSLLFITAIYLLYFLKSKPYGLIAGLVLGLIAILIFYNVINNTSFNNATVVDTTIKVFNVPGFIFINLILIAVPVYLIFVVSSLVFNSNFKDVKKRTYGVSFLSLLSLSIIGIFIAMFAIPLVMLIPETLWHDAQGGHDHALRHGEEAAGFNWLIFVVFGIIILSFFVSLAIKLSVSEHKTQLISETINSVLKTITQYFKLVIYLVPLVLFTRLSSMGLTYNMSEATAKLTIMAIYVGLFMAGSLIILSLLITTTLLLSRDDEFRLNERVKVIFNYLLISFSNQSAAATLPETQRTVEELGACKEVASLTPTKGLFMGMIMCNGFTPMLMSIMILAGGDILTVQNVLICASIIMSLSISTSGAGSSDYWITATTMKIMNPYGVTAELFDWLYLDIILVAHEVNEMTIAKPVNGMGHITATLLTDKYHKKISHHGIGCDCDFEKDNNQEESNNEIQVKQ